MTARAWFEVDRAGLAKIAARRNKNFILRELVQNSWDEASTFVQVEVYPPVNGSGFSTIRVTDDSPDGFKDISHAYTLFAPSAKVTDATKRGRFNFGEKLVLALCNTARIETTTGTILFDKGEKRRRSPKKREAGSMFEGTLKLNAEERTLLVKAARQMIAPDGKTTVVNGSALAPRQPVVSVDHCLSTEIAKEDGTLQSTYRTTTLRVYEPVNGEKAALYEMGIPVVETGDRYHVDVGQKVPLNMERDNVNPAYLRDVRVAVANATAHLLTVEDANTGWARDALGDYQITADAAKRLTELRFGDKAVIYDPSDQEANSLATAKGYTVVTGSQLSGSEWEQIKKHSTMLPAGQVTPSPKPFHPDGRALRLADEITPQMARFIQYAIDVALALTDKDLTVVIADDSGWNCEGAIGNGVLYVNAEKVGGEWFDAIGSVDQNEFLIHELGHTVEGNHLSDRYHEALCKIGAKLVELRGQRPEIFQ